MYPGKLEQIQVQLLRYAIESELDYSFKEAVPQEKAQESTSDFKPVEPGP